MITNMIGILQSQFSGQIAIILYDVKFNGYKMQFYADNFSFSFV